MNHIKKLLIICLTILLLLLPVANLRTTSQPAVLAHDGVLSPAPPNVPDWLVFVEGGSFMMGSEIEYYNDGPVHKVEISSYYISKYEVTQELWKKVMRSNHSNFKGDNLPVEKVNWDDAVEFCNKLSEQEGLTPCYNINGDITTCNFDADGYRLPTEAEWEYAARGGKKSMGYEYSGGNDAHEVAWHHLGVNSSTHIVGKHKANELGLYDMSGNVFEWCWDWYGEYTEESQKDPRGPESGEFRVIRGGCWKLKTPYVRSTFRNICNPKWTSYVIGFRVARSMSQNPPEK